MRRSSTIGGPLGLDALAKLGGADRHRPRTRDEMRAAVHELRQRGMTDHSIAGATRLSVEHVRRLLGEHP